MWAEKKETNLFMGRKHRETRPGWLVLIRRPQCPEGDRSTTKLSEPRFEFRLGSVMRKAVHVEHLATLFQESIDIGTSIHGASQDLRVLTRRQCLPDETSQHSGQCDCLFHGPTGGGRRKSLQMEGEIVLDWG